MIGAIVAKMLNGLGGRFGSFKLGGIFGSCHLNLYGIVGLFESSRGIMSDLWDAAEEIVGISLTLVFDSSVEFRKIGELFRCGLGLFESCST